MTLLLAGDSLRFYLANLGEVRGDIGRRVMNGTIFLIAMLIAAYLYDEGYWAIALFLAGIAVFEAIIVPSSRTQRRKRRMRQRMRRKRDGVTKEDWKDMEPGWTRLWHRLFYGSDDSRR